MDRFANSTFGRTMEFTIVKLIRCKYWSGHEDFRWRQSGERRAEPFGIPISFRRLDHRAPGGAHVAAPYLLCLPKARIDYHVRGCTSNRTSVIRQLQPPSSGEIWNSLIGALTQIRR